MNKTKIEQLWIEKSRLEKIIIMALIPVPFMATIYLLSQIRRIENEIRRETAKDDVIVVVSNPKDTDKK